MRPIPWPALLLAPLPLLPACSVDHGEPHSSTDPASIELPSVGGELPAAMRAVLEAPDAMEILALHPYPHDLDEPAPGEVRFHDHAILGRASIDDPVERRRVIALVYEAIAEHDGVFAACFDPRHGVRARRGSESVDVLICFECFSLHAHGPGEAFASAGAAPEIDPRLTAIFGAHGLSIHGR